MTICEAVKAAKKKDRAIINTKWPDKHLYHGMDNHLRFGDDIYPSYSISFLTDGDFELSETHHYHGKEISNSKRIGF